jgi:hypothetical protein
MSMKDWSFARVLLVATGYILVTLLATIARARSTGAIESGPGGEWKFFWLIPYSAARNYLLLVFLPPVLLLSYWLAMRLYGGVRPH